MISFFQKGDWSKTTYFLTRVLKPDYVKYLHRYGKLGVEALSENTPKDSGRTADSWSYEIVNSRGQVSIYWKNSNINDGVPIAIILQYGHGTGTGGYVMGRDYINPAIRPIFDKMADDVWNEVIKN